MKQEQFYSIISLAILIGLFYLFYRIMSPFIMPIAWALVLSIVFYPLYQFFHKRLRKKGLSALITLALILCVILGPFTYIASSLTGEIINTYSLVEDKAAQFISNIKNVPFAVKILERLGYNIQSMDIKDMVINATKALGAKIVNNLYAALQNVVAIVFNFFMMSLCTFYFLMDGDALIRRIRGLLPFSESHKERLSRQVKEMISATLYGGVVVAIIQGFLGGMAFFFLGLPSPVLWGMAMSIASLLPIIGTFLIWGPAGIILILGGNYLKGIGLLLFGFLVISMVDNVLKPILIGGKTRIHTLIIFLSVLGGIRFFGFIGFIMGPLIVALCISLLEIYSSEPSTEGGHNVKP